MDADWDLLDEVDVLSKLPPNFTELLESKKWSDRRDALQALVQEIEKYKRLDTKVSYDDITSSLRNVLAKDSNINVCAVAAKAVSGLAIGLRSKFAPFAPSFVSVVFEKFKEKKPILRDPLIECIDAVSTTINMESVTEELVSSMDKPNPQIKLQGCGFIYRLMKKYVQPSSPKKLVKAVIPLLIKFTSDSDSDVRDGACCALGSIMRLIGEKPMNTLMGPIVEDKGKMKKVTDARDAATKEVAEAEAKEREARGNGASAPTNSDVAGASASAGVAPSATPVAPAPEPEVDQWELLDPVDVLAKLPPTFTEQVESKKWSDRRDALQALLTLCIDNPRLCPKANYGEHISVLKKILEKDSNINVCATAARCLTAIACGLRKKFSSHASLVAPVIFEKFKEKRPVLRDPLIDCIDAVAASTTLEALADEVQAALEKPNPSIKIQANLFLYRTFKKYNAQTVPKKVLKNFVPIIVKHASDSDPEVRDASLSALGAAMKAVGEKAFLPLIADIAEDKAKFTKIKEFCDKAIQEAGTDVVSVMVQSIHKSNEDGPPPETQTDPSNSAPLKPPAPGVGNKTGGTPGTRGKQPVEEEETGEKESSPKSAKAAEEAQKTPDEVLPVNKEKRTRLRDEKNLKVLKWNFDIPSAEHIEQLKTQFTSVAQSNFCSLLFHKDFKMHLKAIDAMQALSMSNGEAIVANSDLILKWITLRFFETNPTVLLKALELALSVFSLIQENHEDFSDIELASFLPYLILKTGEPKDVVRSQVRAILHSLTVVVGPAKVSPLILEGLKTKNSRQRTECLQVIEHFFDTAGLAAVGTPAVTLKAVANCVADRDNNVRNAALNALLVAWKEEGDKLYTIIGKINDKEKAMLDERIKRSGAVTKAKGGPERVAGMSSRSRPSIGTGVRGRSMGAARSHSRTDSRPTSGDSNEVASSRDPSPEPDLDASSDKRRFALNLKALGLEPCSVESPTLTNSQADADLTLLLNEPVVHRRPQASVVIPRRTESVSSITSLESCAGDVDKAVHAVASISQTTASQAIGQLQYLFTDQAMFRYVADRADAVVQAIVTQTSLIRSRHLNDFASLESVNELIRTICNFLCSLVKERATCSRMSSESLKMLIQEFLYLMKDDRMKQLKDYDSIVRSLNYLSIRVCDNADPTSCYVALCGMLASALLDPRNNTVELITKCIYKQSELFLREVPLDLDAIMLAVHDFMQEFRPKVDESDAVKSSLRCLDISVQRLVHGTRSTILQHVSRIPDPDNSEAVIYVKKCVRSLQSKSNQSSLQSSAYGELPGQIVQYDEVLRSAIAQVATDPRGKGLRKIIECLKNYPEARALLEEDLKARGTFPGEYIFYQLRKLENSEREMPVFMRETEEMFTAVDKYKQCLTAYRQSGVFTESVSGSGAPSTSPPEEAPANVSIARVARRSIQPAGVVSEGAPENEPTLTSHRRNLTANDVEPLRRLLNMRRAQQQ